jgi:hypothetical protein
MIINCSGSPSMLPDSSFLDFLRQEVRSDSVMQVGLGPGAFWDSHAVPLTVVFVKAFISAEGD